MSIGVKIEEMIEEAEIDTLTEDEIDLEADLETEDDLDLEIEEEIALDPDLGIEDVTDPDLDLEIEEEDNFFSPTRNEMKIKTKISGII